MGGGQIVQLSGSGREETQAPDDFPDAQESESAAPAPSRAGQAGVSAGTHGEKDY